jgi:hypothetical protein
MKIYFIGLLFLLVSACTLSANQEASLQKAMSSYLAAHNNGAVMAFVGFTHPNVVGFYQEKGDSVFRERFELFDAENGGDFLQDGTIKKIETIGNSIHVQYIFESYQVRGLDERFSELSIIAISSDDGKTWFFADQQDYVNDSIFNPKERLIDL